MGDFSERKHPIEKTGMASICHLAVLTGSNTAKTGRKRLDFATYWHRQALTKMENGFLSFTVFVMSTLNHLMTDKLKELLQI